MFLVLGILLALMVGVALWAMGIYNGLVALRNQVKNAWSQIDVQLKRRHDLIPNLVQTVKGYAGHERETLESVIAARARAVSAQGVQEQSQAEQGLSGALGRLMLVVEQYPDLKANQNFLALQEELTATEGRVAYSRQFYNDSVLDYNNKLEQFPTVIFARMLHFERREYFEADESARLTPIVEF